ncbi:serine hydrolase domain-containing protein [Nitratireductor pacificus]|uniref:Penicillin-binding protein n=1 Tax=Nitratireductor pacificus pht-3B TaxID=391937 RepID=K2LQG1_9HYPH|nr:serine hydrolase domain-containing protein [Nitratireductor pacificus]EKF20014.1 penicillin-binding protein [Nitratireductor pacificus pht-3B]
MSISTYIDGLFSEWNNAQSPGMIVAVARGDEDLHRGAYGMADLAHAVPMDFRTVTRIASQSKQFTTLLTLMLEQDGLLSLDDDIRDHLDYLPDYGARVTVRHLANNTSGLRDILDMMIIGGTPITAPSSRDLARRTASRSAALNFAPGTELLYSNTNFLFLTEILEKVSGQRFETLLAERLTGPLGMDDTRLMVRDDAILPRLAVHHRRGPDGGWLRAAWGIAIGGEGGLVSSGDDMLRWLRHLARPTVCDPALIARMEAPSATIHGLPSPYGFGLMSAVCAGHRCIGHGGWISGSRSQSLRFPDQDIAISILSNHDDFSPVVLMEKIAAHVLGDRSTRAATRPAALSPGAYRQADGDEIFIIDDGDRQQSLTTGMGSAPLVESPEGRWVPHSSMPPFELSAGKDGTVVTEHFARQRVFRPAGAGAPQTLKDGAAYASATEGLSATLERNGDGWRLRLDSAGDASLLRLEHRDGTLFTAHPAETDPHDQWRFAPWVLPWLFTVRIEPDRLVINSDRTRNLVLDAR